MSYIHGEDKLVKIPKSKLIKLLNAELELNALEAGGVDNWEWYGESFRDYIDMLLEDEGKSRDDEDVSEDIC